MQLLGCGVPGPVLNVGTIVQTFCKPERPTQWAVGTPHRTLASDDCDQNAPTHPYSSLISWTDNGDY